MGTTLSIRLRMGRMEGNMESTAVLDAKASGFSV